MRAARLPIPPRCLSSAARCRQIPVAHRSFHVELRTLVRGNGIGSSRTHEPNWTGSTPSHSLSQQLHRRALSLASVLSVSPEVADAVARGDPVVALESTIITHGLPHPINISTALALEQTIRDVGCIPATVAIIDGVVRVGLGPEDIEKLAVLGKGAKKTSRWDLASVVANGLTGSTTVSSTSLAAHLAGIKVFATGGIGGVHRGGEDTLDISADLTELSRTPVTVVCAGAKAILDIPRTVEYLETQGVPVLTLADGDHPPGLPIPVPAFYTRDSGVPSPTVVRSAAEVARMMATSAVLTPPSGLLLCVPIPTSLAADTEFISRVIDQAVEKARNRGLKGAEVTPWILAEVERESGGEAGKANVGLVINNARVACQVATEYAALARASTTPFAPAPEKEIAQNAAEETDQADGLPVGDGGERVGEGVGRTSRVDELRGRLRVKDKYARPIIIGGATLDITATLLPSSHPTHGTSSPGHVHHSPGGVARNVAEACFRLGVDPVLVTCVGDDVAGETLLGHMEGVGMGTREVRKVAGRRTAVYTAVHGAGGDLEVAVADMDLLAGIGEDVVGEALDRNLNPRTPLIAFDGNISPSAVRHLLRRANQVGVSCLFEPTSVPKSVRIVDAVASATGGLEGADARGMVETVRYLTPNIAELGAIASRVREKRKEAGVVGWEEMSGESLKRFEELEPVLQDIPTLLPDILTLHSFFTHPRFTVVTKLGPRGVLLSHRVPATAEGEECQPSWYIDPFPYTTPNGENHTKLRIKHRPARKSVDVVSVTGAGDSLVGCLVAGVSMFGPDKKLDDVVCAGIAAAEMTVGVRSAVAESLGPGLLEEVECDEDGEGGALRYLF
ncbi:hypothetical protein M427DRAFT_116058 [Gonapodya prolifera JEL478]|uniref:Carbohydrate kinase PfkB domain-containing protein n=1 Tax=Gonapodya prolifera (strain JEL478) TaxID=1344416 RepID=A0A139A0W2_GONPJ|nr:hypothetical protein M427DRAFT_116058 [Gonapodya prolifera JEL478]|eukprot:KXS10401.1 hypothetical protein M427DRAFT_116058 [Gonapodya prolifera JEL478]